MTDPTAERIADEVTTKAAASHMNWHEQRQMMVALITTALTTARREVWEEAAQEAESQHRIAMAEEFRLRSRAQEQT